MKKKMLGSLVVVLLLSVLTSGVAQGWAYFHHDDITRALVDCPSRADSYSNTPDTWGESHFGDMLGEEAEYWAEKAIEKYQAGGYWNNRTGDKYLGYMLHYIEDAGQPWHAEGVGHDSEHDHIGYEIWVMNHFHDDDIVGDRSFKEWVTYGSQYPWSSCQVSDTDEIPDAVEALMNKVDDYYYYMENESEWTSSTGKMYTALALKYVGKCSQGIVDYVTSFRE